MKMSTSGKCACLNEGICPFMHAICFIQKILLLIGPFIVKTKTSALHFLTMHFVKLFANQLCNEYFKITHLGGLPKSAPQFISRTFKQCTAHLIVLGTYSFKVNLNVIRHTVSFPPPWRMRPLHGSLYLTVQQGFSESQKIPTGELQFIPI